jgi:hypothetical protein
VTCNGKTTKLATNLRLEVKISRLVQIADVEVARRWTNRVLNGYGVTIWDAGGCMVHERERSIIAFRC